MLPMPDRLATDLDRAAPPPTPGPGASRPLRHLRPAAIAAVRSATRALELIELFAVRREALSVSAVADALGIPQSSASILLKALNQAGFIERDNRTRRYQPSLRSAFSAQRVGGRFLPHPDLLAALDRVSNRAGCSVRLGVRHGIHVLYAHLFWPETAAVDRVPARPGALRSICHDALGAALLSSESDEAVCATIRHVNAVAGPDLEPVRPADYLLRLRRCGEQGFFEQEEAGHGTTRVLAVRLAASSRMPAAVGMVAAAGMGEQRRAALLQILNEELASLRFGQPSAAAT